MDITLNDQQKDLQAAIQELCKRFPPAYWGELDEKRAYPEAFVQELTDAGWLGMQVPEEYGGLGLGVTEAALVLREINRSGGNATACHAQMYTMGTLLRHGSAEQKQRFLPALARGELRLQSFAVTEPDAGTDTTRIRTVAERKGDRYILTGQKIFISRAQHSDLMLVICRTTPRDQVANKTDGMTLLLVDMRTAGDKLRLQPIRTMVNHETNEVFFDGLEVPVENRIGEEGKGFRCLISGVNSERVLVASEAIGDGLYFIDNARRYACERVVFDRPIGQNQGIQFPIAKAYMSVQAANLVVFRAAALYDRNLPCGEEANMAKYLASEAAWEAANAAMNTYGGYGFAVEYGIERKFRETRLYTIAPISNNLILSFIGQHVLQMPRSY